MKTHRPSFQVRKQELPGVGPCWGVARPIGIHAIQKMEGQKSSPRKMNILIWGAFIGAVVWGGDFYHESEEHQADDDPQM